MSQSIGTKLAAETTIVGVQESHGMSQPRPDLSAEMATHMGWRHIAQGGNTTVMTNYGTGRISDDKRAVKVKIDKS